MNSLGVTLSAILLALVFTTFLYGDEFFCAMGESRIKAYVLCSNIENCEIDYDASVTIVAAFNWQEKYCEK